MSCPVCHHTMQNLGIEGQRVFWCPRCGTLKFCSGDHETVESPRYTRQELPALLAICQEISGLINDEKIVANNSLPLGARLLALTIFGEVTVRLEQAIRNAGG